ncbi:MAG TPA: RNA polymerase sigma factor [Thermoanaerobaculia bacterium]|jgi:RNA polymerase sigma-70 factor (ECF subfamily)|nr:RNA polymerase sigma factor [Thermoanaerobaculia bacterium]
MQEATLHGGFSAIRNVTRADIAETYDDRRIAAACAAGDSAIFEFIYRQYATRMKSIAFHHLGSVADAEDAVQETFLKIHRAAGTYSGEASFSTWVFRILINTCYDLLRKRRRRTDDAPIEDAPERTAPSVDDAKRMTLKKLLAELPEQRRTVFTLFEIEGLSHAEIASILDISEGNSKWILFATKKQLQEQWKATRK